ncbi:MAG: Hsp70 family protein [Thermodesulfobacteriota bacterium]
MTEQEATPIIGIDLGTTNSLVAVPSRQGPVIVANERGERMTPSVVAVHPGQVLVGELARSQAVLNHAVTVTLAKRAMGSRQIWRLQDEDWTPERVSAAILTSLRRTAEDYLGVPVREAVITVPAYFNDRQRQATLQAGEAAGLTVVKLMNEPTAAALMYGLEHGADDRLLVFDLGGGTLDITLIEIREHAFVVRQVGGATDLGGSDFDALLVEELREVFRQEHGLDLAADPVARQQLVLQAERAKRDLSSALEARVMIPYVTITPAGPLHLDLPLTRARAELLFTPLLDRIRAILAETLAAAGVAAGWVNTVIMVGGASRMPCVRRLLTELLPPAVTVRQDLNPEEIVALGAGLLAGVLAGTYPEIPFRDVTAHDLGIEDDAGELVTLIPRGTAYPVERLRVFTTTRDHETAVTIHVLERGEPGAEPVTLAWFGLESLPPAQAGTLDIGVTFAIDGHGILRVRAVEETSGVRAEIQVSRYGAGRAYEEREMMQEA